MTNRAEMHELRERIAKLPAEDQLLLAEEIRMKYGVQQGRAAYFEALRSDVELIRAEEAAHRTEAACASG